MSINWGEELNKMHEATKPMAEGQHTFRVVEAKPTTASTGNRMIKLTVKDQAGPDAGKTAIMNIVFTFDNPRSMKMALRRLRAFGITEEQLQTENLSIEQIAGLLIGRSAEGTVTHRTWNGELQNDVDFGVTGAGSSNGVPPAPTPDVPTPDVPTPDVPAPQPTPDVPSPPVPEPQPTASGGGTATPDPF